MPLFRIETWHAPGECLDILDQVLAQGSEVLATYEFACAASAQYRHAAYVILEAKNSYTAKESLPALLSNRAYVVPVAKLTPADVRALHVAKEEMRQAAG